MSVNRFNFNDLNGYQTSVLQKIFDEKRPDIELLTAQQKAINGAVGLIRAEMQAIKLRGLKPNMKMLGEDYEQLPEPESPLLEEKEIDLTNKKAKK